MLLMFFFPIGYLVFILFILFLPVLLVLGYFQVITIGFEKLGFSPEATIFVFLLMLIGSVINIPLTKKKLVYTEERKFWGLIRAPRVKVSGIGINLGGAIIPLLISFYFLFKVPLVSALIATFLMIVICKYLARVVPGRGIVLPALIPPLFAAFLAFALAPEFIAPTAFISGVLGTLIGGDILNLRKARRAGSGFLSIGGAGVFDGIFLVGIISALLS